MIEYKQIDIEKIKASTTLPSLSKVYLNSTFVLENGIPTHYIPVGAGMKIYPNPNNVDTCNKIAGELYEHGVSSRIAQNMDSRMWSIYIIEVSEKIGEKYEL